VLFLAYRPIVQGMGQDVDPSLTRFLRLHSTSIQEEVEADVAEARELTPLERWQTLVRLSKCLTWIRTQSPEHQARVLAWRDPPAASYTQLVARLRTRPSA
jgi:hypothetical protein